MATHFDLQVEGTDMVHRGETGHYIQDFRDFLCEQGVSEDTVQKLIDNGLDNMYVACKRINQSSFHLSGTESCYNKWNRLI